MVTELKDDWENVLTKNRISVVKCYADWCGPCKFYAPHFQRFSDNFDVYMDTEIKYYQGNNDKLDNFKEEFKIDRLPSTLFFVYGILVYKVQGVTRQSVLEDILEKSLKIPYKKE